MLVVCCVFFYADNDDHGSRQGNTARALTQWQHLVASCEATDALHWAMFIALFRPGSMAIKLTVEFFYIFYILDNSVARKNISPSFLPFS
jgi:hypothetical protein